MWKELPCCDKMRKCTDEMRPHKNREIRRYGIVFTEKFMEEMEAPFQARMSRLEESGKYAARAAQIRELVQAWEKIREQSGEPVGDQTGEPAFESAE